MTNFITHSTTRRSFLRVGSTVLAIPFWKRSRVQPTPSNAPPKRVIFLGGGFGFTADTFYPKQAGRFSEIGLTEGLAPLQRHQDDITMVANMTKRRCKPIRMAAVFRT